MILHNEIDFSSQSATHRREGELGKIIVHHVIIKIIVQG